ncbi:hypothetical protein HBB16_08395 [Pseudonocardia sp. MCCB 268]|nr:hypothetical protein [Pseudonocardia cytotoxica]
MMAEVHDTLPHTGGARAHGGPGFLRAAEPGRTPSRTSSHRGTLPVSGRRSELRPPDRGLRAAHAI